MLRLSEWSFARVLIVSVAWVIGVVGWQVLHFYLLFRRMRAETGGIGAVSVGMFGIASILFGPPLLLLLVWIVVRFVHRT